MKKLLSFVSALAFLAMAAPSKSQDYTASQVQNELVTLVETAIRENGGRELSVFRSWGYINPDQSLLFCGAGFEHSRLTTFVVYMDGIEDDLVGFAVPLERMRELGCDNPDFRAVRGTPPASAPLSGLNPDPRPTTSTFVRLTIPAQVRDEPECVAGRNMARRLLDGDANATRGVPPDALRRTDTLFGLCYNATGQALVNGRMGAIIASSDLEADELRARRLLMAAEQDLRRARARGYY